MTTGPRRVTQVRGQQHLQGQLSDAERSRAERPLAP